MGRTDARLAANRGVNTLYKFRPFSSELHRQRVREILVEHKVYFSRRSQLNDPFDLTPVFDFAMDRTKLMQDAERAWKRRLPPPTENELRNLRSVLATQDLNKLAAAGSARALERIEKDYWVFSLAGNRDHPMLWSHYAEGHTGLCIHFAADGNSPFGAAQQVWYKSKRPVVPVPILIPEEEAAARVTLIKGEFWRYEQEYRFIRYPNTFFEDIGLRFDGQHAFYLRRLLTGVTLGARMAQPRIDEVLALAAAHNPPVPVWKAIEQRTFKFRFEPLTGPT